MTHERSFFWFVETKMKINILNDLHLEFDRGPTLALPGGETLLLAGDICVAAYLRPNRTDKDARKHVNVCKAFFHQECAKYERVYYVMGNHEHYNGIFDYTAETLREFLEGTNVTLLDKEWVKLKDGWSLFGGTLWTNYNNRNWFAMHAAKDKMNDHTIIKCMQQDNKLTRFLPTDAADEHDRCFAEIAEGMYDMDRIDDNKIIMTHHAPCGKSIHPRFTGDLLNYAYYTELGNEIADNLTFKYWIHGHMHDTWDYTVGECRVLCNPRGYQGHQLNPEFNTQFEFEI